MNSGIAFANLIGFHARASGVTSWGDAADIEAAMRADELMAAGDMEGQAVWLRIGKAIEELLSEERPDDAEVH